jgi:hypothetical protein
MPQLHLRVHPLDDPELVQGPDPELVQGPDPEAVPLNYKIDVYYEV